MKTIKISDDLHRELSQIKALQRIKTLDKTIAFCMQVDNPNDYYSEKFMEEFRNDKSKK